MSSFELGARLIKSRTLLGNIVLSSLGSPSPLRTILVRVNLMPLENKEIVILKADKGGASIILDKVDYLKKMLDHLCNSGSYKKLINTPLKRISKNSSLPIKSSNIVASFSHKLIDSSPITLKIYGLPDIHKDGPPQDLLSTP